MTSVLGSHKINAFSISYFLIKLSLKFANFAANKAFLNHRVKYFLMKFKIFNAFLLFWKIWNGIVGSI